ncbi:MULTISPECIES: transposase [Sphingobium]|uniref:transposase n=1 Tax=Sphingobium TaxID=165695 RepID=UPI002100F478|nr:transposase [Sphingobium sp. 15-1]
MGRIEVITRTERRRKYSPAERDAIMREADAPDVTVREVAKRHDIAESLIYSWRTARRQAEKIASEPLTFISYGTVPEGPSPLFLLHSRRYVLILFRRCR